MFILFVSFKHPLKLFFIFREMFVAIRGRVSVLRTGLQSMHSTATSIGNLLPHRATRSGCYGSVSGCGFSGFGIRRRSADRL